MCVQILSERELPGGLVIQHKRFAYPDMRPWTAYGAFFREGNALDYASAISVRDAVAKLMRRVAWKRA